MKTVGQILSFARNSKNLSISDISTELKISKNIIINLENDNEINFALIPDIPESLEPIVEKSNTFDNLSQSTDITKSDLINNSSAIASIEFDENVTTVATLKMLNPTWVQ